MHRDKLVPQDHLDHKDPLEALYVPLHAPALFQYVLNFGEHDSIHHVYDVICFLQLQGDDGTDGEDGTPGAAGEQGAIGPHGPPGPHGDSGPPVTILHTPHSSVLSCLFLFPNSDINFVVVYNFINCDYELFIYSTRDLLELLEM